MNSLEISLFDTNSIKIAPAEKPFWYTSGTIGPYFINTHFLYGGEEKAVELLNYINKTKDDRELFIPELTDRVITFYNTNDIFKNVIDTFYEMIKDIPSFRDSEYISGGERRDWFFSPIIAHLSSKKLLYIYKDLKTYDINGKIRDLNNSSVAHICDLITKASSFQRAWIPAINNINGNIIFNASIVDRDEGGSKLFEKNNIDYFSAVKIDNTFLTSVLERNIINEKQFKYIKEFKNNSLNFGKSFIQKDPTFLKDSLNDDAVKSKAQRCINENPYNINFSNILV